VNKGRGSHEEFLAVKDAYDTLSNPLLRREYDERTAAEPLVGWDDTSARPKVVNTVRASSPFVPPRQVRSVRIRSASEQRQRQLGFLYTATVAGSSVAFLAGSFLLVALGGIAPGIVAFLMGLVLVLVMFHVLPGARAK
jgi:curved DNA-binding protein CbpA